MKFKNSTKMIFSLSVALTLVLINIFKHLQAYYKIGTFMLIH